MNPIVHKYKSHGDYRNSGQTDHEFKHSTVCGYVRNKITHDDSLVTCKNCLKELKNQQPENI